MTNIEPLIQEYEHRVGFVFSKDFPGGPNRGPEMENKN